MVFFHGYNGTPELWAGREEVVAAFHDAGALLVLPAGRDGTWNLANTRGSTRDERAFVEAVREEVERRWHPSTFYASGHSIGGSLTHELACDTTGAFRAFAPMAGVFWDPLPTGCPTPDAVSLYHLHGVNDETFPMEGRSLGSMTQGDVEEALDLWLRHDGCARWAEETRPDGATCRIGVACRDGVDLRLCLHDGGHPPPDGWVQQQLAWFDTLD